MNRESTSLGDHYEAFIRSLISTGRYRTREDVIREALRCLEEQVRKATAIARLNEGMQDVLEGRTYLAKPAIRRIADEFGFDLGK